MDATLKLSEDAKKTPKALLDASMDWGTETREEDIDRTLYGNRTPEEDDHP